MLGSGWTRPWRGYCCLCSGSHRLPGGGEVNEAIQQVADRIAVSDNALKINTRPAGHGPLDSVIHRLYFRVNGTLL